MRVLRAMAGGWAIHFKQDAHSPCFLWIVSCTPLIYATMACFQFCGGTAGPRPFATAVGTRMVGIWSLTTTTAAASLLPVPAHMPAKVGG